MKVKVENPEQFVKRMFFLLWKAIGCTTGMGCYQDRPSATEDEVFNGPGECIVRREGPSYNPNLGRGDFWYYGDYVFGRMMKFGCTVKDGVIELRDDPFRADYQGFSLTYPDNEAVVKATADSLGIKQPLLPQEARDE